MRILSDLNRFYHCCRPTQTRNRRTSTMTGRAGLVAVVLCGFLCCQEGGEAQEMRSPDGRRVAYIAARTTDQWSTLFVKEKGKPRDLLPGDVGGTLGSAGRRGIMLGAWAGNEELSFQYHCGTGCVAVYRIDVRTGRVVELWKGAVDSGVHWSPRGDRALVGTHLGGLLMISSEAKHTEVSGCQIVDGKAIGHMYAFEEWMRDSSKVLVRELNCDKFGEVPSGGERLTWDGHNFSLPPQ